MSQGIEPFKIELLIPTRQDLQGMKPVKVMDIMSGLTKNFHPEGLFSTEIFGKVGDERRNRTFAYINLNIPIFHPLVYKVLCDLKELYQEVMAGKVYAIFDEERKDFFKSNIAEGETGYAFFLKHFEKLQFEERKSISRSEYIQFINLYRNNPFIQQLVVLPAGVRDYTVDEDGKPSEDEINATYRSIMSVASMMESVRLDVNPEFIDAARYNLQVKVLELYKYIIGLVLGKHKMVQGSFLSRKVSNTTRNVISSYIPETKRYGDPLSISPNTTVIGLYQYLRDIMPLTVYHVTNKYMNKVFTSPNSPASLIDPKTMRKKMVTVSPRNYDTWMTYNGIEKMADLFGEETMRHYPVTIDGYYLGLVYTGPDGTFKFIQDIEEIPQDRRKDAVVAPITMTELFYMAVYEEAMDSFGYTTRYPITSFGSTFPGDVALRTTTRSEIRTELDDDWMPRDIQAVSFPIKDQEFFNAMAVPPAHLGRLGADHDGRHSCHL